MKFLKNTTLLLIIFSMLISACSYPPLNDELGENHSDYTYQIGSGDVVNVFIWDNPDISRSVVVRPDGKITVPLVEDLFVSGKTPYQVARELEKIYASYIREPEVVVMVSGFRGVDSQQIKVVGQIGRGRGSSGGSSSGRNSRSRYRGRSMPYKAGMTLLDVIIVLGSIGQFADGNRASIIRKVNGIEMRYGVKIDDLVEDGKLSENVAMLPGDILIIPQAYF